MTLTCDILSCCCTRSDSPMIETANSESMYLELENDVYRWFAHARIGRKTIRAVVAKLCRSLPSVSIIRVGNGAFGQVFRMTRDSTNCCLKFGFRSTPISNTECAVARKLIEHPSPAGLVRIRPIQAHCKTMLLIMPSADMSLDLYIRRHICTNQTVTALRHLIAGLHHLHCVIRCTHGDLSPRNVLVTCSSPTHVFQICDMGSSVLLDQPENLPLSGTAMSVASPEQIIGATEDEADGYIYMNTPNPSTDIWSLGCVALSLSWMDMRVGFIGESYWHMSILHAQHLGSCMETDRQQYPPEFPRFAASPLVAPVGTPTEVIRLLEVCLRREADRPSDAGQLAIQIQS